MQEKRKSGRRSAGKIIIVLFLILVCTGVYYQLFYHPQQVNSGIAVPGKTFVHANEVWAAKFIPNSENIASGSVDSTVQLWNKEDGHLLRTLKHPAGVTNLSISKNGALIVTSSYDGLLRIWRIADGALLHILRGHEGTVWSVCFSPDDNFIASCGEDKTVRLWNVNDGTLIRTLKGHSMNI